VMILDKLKTNMVVVGVLCQRESERRRGEVKESEGEWKCCVQG
jgi:hypothetical protein